MNASASPPPPPAEKSNPVSSFVAGARYPTRALRFLVVHPSLWPLAALPFAITLIIYAVVLVVGWHFAGGWIDTTVFQREGFWVALGWILVVLFWILALALMAILFIPVAAVLCSPFNDLLSEKAEKIYRGVEVDEPLSLKLIWRGIRVGITGELRRMFVLGGLLIFAFSFNLIPGVGQIISAILSAIFTSMYLSLEFTSYSMDRRYYTWKQKKGFLQRFRARTLGFGATAFLIMLVPFLNALFLPVSAIAGTILFCDTELAE